MNEDLLTHIYNDLHNVVYLHLKGEKDVAPFLSGLEELLLAVQDAIKTVREL